MSHAIDERKQFRILFNDFVSRTVDLDLITPGEDARRLIVRFGSALAALSFVFTYIIVPRYATSPYSHTRLSQLAWSDEEFLISATMALAGLCAVMSWNTVFPDRRDSLILGLIPIRRRTMMAARAAAIATVLAIVIATLNLLTGISFPFVLAIGVFDGLARFVTWWAVLLASGAFVFCAFLAIQAIASQLLPWRRYLQMSGILQMGALFAVLSYFFLAPAFDQPDPPRYIPSFWFVGLLHVLRADSTPLFASLAREAAASLAVIPIACALFALSWVRDVRRIVEAPDIVPARRPWLANKIARLLCPAPFARAILLFTARTAARSRQHRLMIAIYGSFGFALSLAFCKSLLGVGSQRWHEPNLPMLIAGVLLLAIAISGLKSVFALPSNVRANWIFRITAVHRPKAYFAAVRKAVFLVGAFPVWLAAAVAYFMMWPNRPALEQSIVLALAGFVMIERALHRFRKVPFTCTWLPGNAQNRLRMFVWMVGLLLAADAWAALQIWTMEKLARLLVLLTVLAAFGMHSMRRRLAFANDPVNSVQFEDQAPAEIQPLDLRQDGAWSGEEAYIEAIDPHRGRTLLARARPVMVGALLFLVVGFGYEQYGEWRDRRAFPQIGRSVDIGGRSLNIYCSGEGSPAVVFEAGGGQPGYSWLRVQPAVAAITKACWYDRSGHGWSDPAPAPRSAADTADDLHRLLNNAGIKPPYVMAGHSYGGFIERVFADRYRQDVAGMVLVDSADEYEERCPGPEAIQSTACQYLPYSLWGAAETAGAFLIHAGAGRLADDGVMRAPRGMSLEDAKAIHALRMQPKAFDAENREGDYREETKAQVRAVKDLGDMPLIVLTAAAGIPKGDDEASIEMAAYMDKRIHVTQAHLATLSTRGRQYLVQSGHGIPQDAPDAVIAAVKQVVVDARGRRADVALH